MSDFLGTFAPKVAGYSLEQCTKLLAVVNQQLELSVDDVQHGAGRIDNALTEPHRQMWALFTANQRHAVSDLEQLKELLEARRTALQK